LSRNTVLDIALADNTHVCSISYGSEITFTNSKT